MKKIIYPIIIIVSLIISISLYFTSEKLVKVSNYDMKIKAAQLMEEASAAIKDERIARNHIMNEDDVNETYLLGDYWTPITTTSGHLQSKRTTTNPSFAALAVELFDEMNVEKGDYVALSYSGSFLAATIATLCAAEVLELKPIIMASVGASNYGATMMDFTIIDIIEFLNDKGIISNHVNYASIGGIGDIGKGMESDTLDSIYSTIEKYDHIKFIYEKDFETNIKKRYDYLKKDSNYSIKAFLTVGGNMVALGRNSDDDDRIEGVVTHKDFELNKDSGLTEYFLNDNIPVAQILSIKKLVNRYGLSYDPIPLPEIGTEDIYFELGHNILYIYIEIGILILILLSLIFHDKIYKLKK